MDAAPRKQKSCLKELFFYTIFFLLGLIHPSQNKANLHLENNAIFFFSSHTFTYAGLDCIFVKSLYMLSHISIPSTIIGRMIVTT
ncbi:hypothetical protein BDF20DRAFT_863650 [Mycotypha africana]|uniref:uncharacterized protein n=1 Tax=Mycotypha africana TaxID=64632 RepID=UPI002301C40A|nr:uncharacterized protein BDF20DRAFT_863650 [Mycotypha africana]KAI8981864.1 hypothetical protein BDF20DRAFT_863650 [Mycotypha africana]